MAWRIAQSKDLDDLIAFLRVREWGHVGFSARLLPNGKKTFPLGSQARIYLNVLERDHHGSIRHPVGHQSGKPLTISEAILISSIGSVVPILAHDAATERGREDIREIFTGRTNQKAALRVKKSHEQTVHSIMGLNADVLSVERCLSKEPYAALDYHLMTAEEILINGSRGYSVGECKRGKPRDIGLLYPLQKAYEMEEVLLDPSNFNSRLCYMNLQKSLKREMVYYIIEDGRVFAKAASNAQGFEFVQIGGVYTVEEHRSQGYGAAVLHTLLSKIVKKGKKACLFVKKDNGAAIKLYSKLGFSVRGEFRISYFH